MYVKKLTKEVRKTICTLLTVSMVFTNTGLTTFAIEESIQTEEVLTEQTLTEEGLQEETETIFTEEEEHNGVEKNELAKETNGVEDSNVSEENVLAEEINAMNESDMSEKNIPAEERNAVEESSDFIASGSYENITWVLDKDGNLTIKGTGEFAAIDDTSNKRAPWSNYYESIKTASVNVEGMTNASYMFYCCSNLTELDLSGFNTENVTNMASMFFGCSNLTNLDLSSFNTRNVTNMASLFSGCKKLKNLDLSGFDTRNVTNMRSMFSSCQNLRNLDVSGFDTGNVTDMSSMFYGYSGFDLNVRDFNTEKVTKMTTMFKDCKYVERLNVGYFNTENVTDMREMFSGCSSLTRLSIGNFSLKNMTSMEGMFKNCSNLEYLNLNTLNTENITNMKNIFSGCSGLTELNLSYFDTKNITFMDSMFSGCSGLTKLDLSNFDTKNVSSMHSMFSGCSGLTELNLSNFDTKNVSNMGLMFSGCSGLTELNLNNFDTKNATNMSYMFNECSGLKSLDLSSFETENVKDMTCMFLNCKSLQSLDISSFDVSNASTAASINGCINLRSFYTPYRTSYGGRTSLPDGGTWYDRAGKTYTEIPESSILLTKYKIPDAVTAHIIAMKTKTVYECGDVVNTDDLRVKYYAADGTIKWLESNEYTTNAAEINTLRPGEENLTIVYNGLTAEVMLIILERDESNEQDESSFVDESSADESSSIPESDATEESSSTEESKAEESSTISESNTIEESSSIEESNTEEGSTTPESNTTEESSSIEESSTTEESDPKDEDDSPYEDSERIDLKSINSTIASIKAKVYDGNAYEPIVKVTAIIGGKKTALTEGADYCVLYQNNINAGIGTVIVRGNGIYKGEITRTFTIHPKSVKKLKIITGSIVGADSSQHLPVYVYDGTKFLRLDKDYTLSNYKTIKATSAQVTISAVKTSNYTGSTIAKFTVYENSAGGMVKLINPENITLEKDTVEYTGKAITPKVTVSVSGKQLTDKDYKVQYQNNKNAGTGFVIVTGKGEYKGKVALPFTINAEIVASDAITIKPISTKIYNGKLQKPTVTVTIQKDGKAKKLTKNKDYTIAYEDNFHAGKATITVTGKGNYEGLTAVAKFTINPQDIKKVSLKGTQGNLVLMYSKRILREGTDYEKPMYNTAIGNNVEVTIKGKNDFTGVITKKIKIN